MALKALPLEVTVSDGPQTVSVVTETAETVDDKRSGLVALICLFFILCLAFITSGGICIWKESQSFH